MNPFQIPYAAGDLLPLMPWKHPEHEGLYVDIGGAEEAFERFKGAIAAPAAFTSAGGFFLVRGEKGCGKTSLVNRCAHWLSARLREADVTAMIVDLTEYAPYEDMDVRAQIVYEHLIGELSERLASAWRDALTKHADRPFDGYSYLRDALDPREVVLILLPKTELAQEVLKYAGAAHSKIVFFAEGYDEVNALTERDLSLPRGGVAAVVQVGPLQDGDGRRFSAHRMKLYADRDDSVVRLDLDAVDRLIRGRRNLASSLSVETLQKTMYGVYKELEAGASSGPREVGYRELTDYIGRRLWHP